MKTDLDCPQVLSLLKSDYLDNELEPDVKTRVDQHLAYCANCRSVKENLLAITTPLRTAARETPPRALWPAIQAEIRGGAQAARPVKGERVRLSAYIFKHKPAWTMAAAAMLVLAAIGFFLQTNKPELNGQTPSLTSLAGYEETNESKVNFGSCIENYLL